MTPYIYIYIYMQEVFIASILTILFYILTRYNNIVLKNPSSDKMSNVIYYADNINGC